MRFFLKEKAPKTYQKIANLKIISNFPILFCQSKSRFQPCFWGHRKPSFFFHINMICLVQLCTQTTVSCAPLGWSWCWGWQQCKVESWWEGLMKWYCTRYPGTDIIPQKSRHFRRWFSEFSISRIWEEIWIFGIYVFMFLRLKRFNLANFGSCFFSGLDWTWIFSQDETQKLFVDGLCWWWKSCKSLAWSLISPAGRAVGLWIGLSNHQKWDTPTNSIGAFKTPETKLTSTTVRVLEKKIPYI